MQSWQPTQLSNPLIHLGEASRIIVRVTHAITSSLLILNINHIITSRRAYYKDMSSNLVIEKALRAASDFSCLDLTNAEGLKVTKEQAKGYNQYLAAFDSVRFADDLE